MIPLDSQSIKQFRKDVDEALKEVGEKYGGVFTIVRLTYGETEARAKLEFEANVSEDFVPKQLKDLRIFAAEYEGKQFSCQGEIFEIVGYRPKASKNVFVGKSLKNQKEYIFPRSTVDGTPLSRQAFGS